MSDCTSYWDQQEGLGTGGSRENVNLILLLPQRNQNANSMSATAWKTSSEVIKEAQAKAETYILVKNRNDIEFIRKTAMYE